MRNMIVAFALALAGCTSPYALTGVIEYGPRYPACPDSGKVEYWTGENGKQNAWEMDGRVLEMWKDWPSSCESARFLSKYGPAVARVEYGVDVADVVDGRYVGAKQPGSGEQQNGKMVIRDNNGRVVGTITY